MKSSRRRAVIAALLVWASSAEAAPQLSYVIVVSRHGVRSPTWEPARLNQYSAEPWPEWGVPPGDLTPHGRKLITILGSYYRDWLIGERLLSGQGCGDRSRVYIWADTNQRTLETGRAFSESVLPGCGARVNSRPAGAKDPIFEGLQNGNPQIASEEVKRRIGSDPGAFLAAHRPALDTLQFILDGGRTTTKKLISSPTEVGVTIQSRAVELKGPFAPASTMSENLLLEYASGMRGRDLGWGRVTKENLFQVLELHRLYADLMRRTPYIARARGSNLLAHVLASMEQAVSGKAVIGALGPPGSAVLILAGHDTNQSNLAGMLGLSWTLPGYQPDETPPGGSLIFSLWRDPADGSYSVQLSYLAASMDQMRDADKLTISNPPMSQPLLIQGCADASSTAGCSWQNFRSVMLRSIEKSAVDFDIR